MNLLLIQSWGDWCHFNGASWFLSSLLFSYFCSFLLIPIVRKVNHPIFLLSCVFIGQLLFNQFVEYQYSHPLYRVFDFFAGMLLARSVMQNGRSTQTFIAHRQNKLEILLVIFFLIQYFAFILIDYKECHRFVSSICFALILFFAACLQEEGCLSRYLTAKPLLLLSKYSFEIYMFHELVFRAIRRILLGQYHWTIVAVCFIVGIPITFIIVKVYLSIKQKLSTTH